MRALNKQDLPPILTLDQLDCMPQTMQIIMESDIGETIREHETDGLEAIHDPQRNTIQPAYRNILVHYFRMTTDSLLLAFKEAWRNDPTFEAFGRSKVGKTTEEQDRIANSEWIYNYTMPEGNMLLRRVFGEDKMLWQTFAERLEATSDAILMDAIKLECNKSITGTVEGDKKHMASRLTALDNIIHDIEDHIRLRLDSTKVMLKNAPRKGDKIGEVDTGEHAAIELSLTTKDIWKVALRFTEESHNMINQWGKNIDALIAQQEAAKTRSHHDR